MTVFDTEIADVKIVVPKVFSDERGYFFESFSQKEFDEKIKPIVFVQDNESKSCYGVVRGLHFQNPPFAQSKLIRCIKGKILDVALDIRRSSPTYGRFVQIELNEEKPEYLYIPSGFAHGFSVLSAEAIIQYKCDNYYQPKAEAGIFSLSPDLGIDWQIPKDKIIMSVKDKTQTLFTEFKTTFI